MNTMKYCLDNVRDGYQKGWLKASLLNNREIMIPYGILVEKLFADNKTAIYKILEGIYQNSLITIPIREAKVFVSCKTKSPLDIQIKVLTKQLRMNGKNYPVIIDSTIRLGVYNVYIPDRPHKENLISKYQYETSGGSRFASTWFRIANTEESIFNSNIYLHFGTYSLGCVTIPYDKTMNRSLWTDIVMTLSQTRIRHGVCARLLISK